MTKVNRVGLHSQTKRFIQWEGRLQGMDVNKEISGVEKWLNEKWPRIMDVAVVGMFHERSEGRFNRQPLILII